MEQMKDPVLCKICNSETTFAFSASILNKYEVPFSQCPHCDFLAPDEIFWLEEAYQEPINREDTGLISRNIHLAKITATLLYFFFKRSDNYLDYAGGYGILTRLMRDSGFHFYWYDAYTENLFARGFEFDPESDQKFALATAFECFEHFMDPLQEIEKILQTCGNILFSTVLLPSPTPAPQNWWYYGFRHGQHVAFYSAKSLSLVARKFKLNFYSFQNVHLFATRKISSLLYATLVKLGPKIIFPILPVKKYSLTVWDHNKLSNGSDWGGTVL
ncbi:MAG: class I SAM-dependent methyltransferase [Calditrichaeota bacterium]|nr:class I SAM-dependent methyltransferase [Calditrichota bacterium]RQW04012.1 MAG: class I SAM-dependent methyltransferase [Calditrichota bacterium]